MDALEGTTLLSGSVLTLPPMVQIEEAGAISSASGAVSHRVKLSAAGDMVSVFSEERFSFKAPANGTDAAQFRSSFSADLQGMGGRG